MRIRKIMAVAVGAAACCSTPLSAQTNALTSNTNLLRVTCRASCRGQPNGRMTTRALTDRQILVRAFNISNLSARTINQEFALVYNPQLDSIQAVNLTTSQSIDVIHFGGGVATSDGRSTERFALMFFPGQTNEAGLETNVFGTAVISERLNGNNRARISGRLQFVESSGSLLGIPGMSNGISPGSTNATGTVTNAPGGTNSTPGTNAIVLNGGTAVDSTAEICVGTFTTTREATRNNTGAGTAVTAPTTNTSGAATTTNGATPGMVTVSTPSGTAITTTTPGTAITTTTPTVTTTTPVVTTPTPVVTTPTNTNSVVTTPITTPAPIVTAPGTTTTTTVPTTTNGAIPGTVMTAP